MVTIPENYVRPRGMALVPGGTLTTTVNGREYRIPMAPFTVNRTHYTNGGFKDYMTFFKDRQLAVFGVSPTGRTTLLVRGSNERKLLDRADALLVGAHASDTLVIRDVVPKKSPSPPKFDHDDQPVVCVDWWTAQSVVQAQGLRLLTADEHEYLARAAGTRVGPEVHGTDDGTLREVAGTPSGLNAHCSMKIQQQSTAVVGSYAALRLPNDKLVYDVCGNVLTWCDRYLAVEASANRDVTIHADPVNRYGALGGASWHDNHAPNLLAGYRNSNRPDNANYYFGIRGAGSAPGL